MQEKDKTKLKKEIDVLFFDKRKTELLEHLGRSYTAEEKNLISQGKLDLPNHKITESDTSTCMQILELFSAVGAINKIIDKS